MFCTECGTRNAEISNFCKQCGHKLDRASTPRISEEAFDRALPLEEQVSALLERAYRLRKSGELSAAVRLCEEALHLNPESTSVHSLLGQIHEQTGNREAALHEYERVLQLNPGSIADRVKLDELRGEGLPVPLHPHTGPHIVMPNRAQPNHSLSNPSGRQMLGIAGICGALMVMGGLIALQFFAHQDKNGNASTTGTPRNGTRLATAGSQTDPASGTGTGASAPTNVAGSNSAAANGPGSSPSSFPISYGPQSYQPPIVYVNSPPPVIIHDRPSTVASVRNTDRLPNMETSRPPATSDNGYDPVRLPDDSGSKVIINVHPNGDTTDPTPPSGGGKPPKGQTGAPKPTTQNPPPIQNIEIHQHKENTGPAGSIAGPTTESQSQIKIAGDKVKAGAYDTAINNYRRALPGAGSQTAYVYMQMGICYQHIKNKANAIDNFSKAIDEYHKLESANQQVDLAQVGIKVCENGIKLCNAE